MVLPPCLSKLARYCACEVAPLSCFSKPTHLVGSPTRLFKYARQVGSPSHPTESCHQVDCSSTLAELTLCVFSSSHPTKVPHQGQSSCTLTKSLRQVASPSGLAKSTRPLAPPTCHFESAPHVSSPSRQLKFARQVNSLCSLIKSPPPQVTPTGRLFESCHQVGSPNGFTTLPQKVGSLLCLPSCPTELLL
jgi:hypothetical protein